MMTSHNTTTLRAYHGDPAIKSALLAQLASHREADEIIKGYYWENGKGCAVGCTIHGEDHMAYEAELGIPVMLAHLEDVIFEGLLNADAKLWPERFSGAIVVGSDLSRVGWKFLHWLLTDAEVNPGIKDPLVSDAVRQCADVLAPTANIGRVDVSAARSAANAAWNAARSAANAAWSAESAVWNAAWSAASAERSAVYIKMADKLVALIEEAGR